MVPARERRGQAAGIAPTERLADVEEADGSSRQESVLFSFSVAVNNNLEVQEDLSTMRSHGPRECG